MSVYPSGVEKKWYVYHADSGAKYRVHMNSDRALSGGFGAALQAQNLNAYQVLPRKMRMRGVYLQKIDASGQTDKRNFCPIADPQNAKFKSGGTLDFEQRGTMTITGRRGERHTQ